MSVDRRAYWVWAQQAFGEGSPLPWRIFREYPGGLEGFFEGGPRLWNTLGTVTDQKAAAMYAFTLQEAEARLEYVEKIGWQVYTPEDPQKPGKYPDALRNIYDPPAVLYGKGKLPDVDRIPAIAVAGARKAVEESQRAASAFGYQLASGGAVVVSGGAVGIDAAALMGAISAEGTVISVLPVDLGSPYLNENAALRRLVTDHGGVLLSEYFSQRTPTHGTFQVRNRLITGLACGVLLIQGALKSGTAIYGKLAAEQNRDVFVFPPPPGLEGSPLFAGSEKLIADGAKAVRCGEEILEEYDRRFRTQRKGDLFDGLFELPEPPGTREKVPGRTPVLAEEKDAAPEGLSPEGEKIWKALEDGVLSVNELEQRTGLHTGTLLSTLTELEMDGLVDSAPGKRYSRAKR